jgi:AbrB family looped-hinge helix DNA binding protein
MTTKLTIDQAGRILLPKKLRQEMQLAPGDTMQLQNAGDEITLRPERRTAILKKEHGLWVYQGEPTDVSIPDLIDRERAKRTREIIG